MHPRTAPILGALLLLGSATAGAQPPFFSRQLDPQLSTPQPQAAYPGQPPGALPPQSTTQTPAPPPVERELDDSVFGGTLFQGHFAQESFRGFNPDYVVSVGDYIDLRLWGAVDMALRLEVDSQGNIFIPRVGPVRVANVRNAELDAVVERRIKRIYRENVGVYASLAAAEPVKVFVTGGVQAPGLYGAYAADSLLHFLDRAGGIDLDTGSFLDVRVLRSGRTAQRFNIYDFLVDGQLPLFQFRDGDTIIVGPRQETAEVGGMVYRPAQYEFEDSIALGRLLELAGVDPQATHVELARNASAAREVRYLTLADPATAALPVRGGDEVHVTADRETASIVAQVEGEIAGLSRYVLPYTSSLADLLVMLEPTTRSDLDGVQLFRRSLAERQKEVLEQMLQKLEQSVLSARSSTREEAQLRAQEAELVLRFVERARDIEPTGQLVLHSGYDPERIALEDRDRLLVPRLSQTVAVQGEVYFPSAFIHREGKGLEYYLQMAGGLSQNGSKDHVFIRRPNGVMIEARRGWLSAEEIRPGDEILVLPKVDAKTFQFSKDLVQILYQIALSAGVVLRI